MTTGDFERYARARPFFGLRSGTNRFISEAFAEASAGTFLEVGAGDGWHLRELIDQGSLRGFHDLYASDLAEARCSRIKLLVPEASVFASTAERLPVASASIDVYYSDQVIEHVADDHAMAVELCRVLKERGRAVVGSVIKGRGAWYFRRNNGHWRLDATHVREYASLAAFERVFAEAGLSVVRSMAVPLSFSLRDLATRLALVTTLVREDGAATFRGRLPEVTIPIPRYALCYATLRKSG